jgi:putative DNA primase/helicase
MADPADHYLRAAMEYAAQGWRVFPCQPETKQPLVKGDLDPASGQLIRGSGGLKKATIDPDIIREWWAKWPKALIGVPTGIGIGAFVVDIDAGVDDATGEVYDVSKIRDDLQTKLGITLPPTWICRTPRGGEHHYFGLPHGAGMPHNRVGVINRVDIRGEGGYVIVPPSARPDGQEYAWITAPDHLPLAPAPQAVLDFALRSGRWADAPRQIAPRSDRPVTSSSAQNKEAYARAAFDAELNTLRLASPGTRNDTLFKVSLSLGQLVGASALEYSSVRDALAGVVRQWPNFGKSMGTIESGFIRGLAEPRDLSHIREDRRTPAIFENVEATNSNTSVRTEKTNDLSGGVCGTDGELAFHPLTDLGNAERFKARMQERFAWCLDTPFWWTGKAWAREGARQKVKVAEHEVARCIQKEAEWLRGSGRDVVVEVKYKGTKAEEEIMLSDKLRLWGRLSEDSRRLSAITARASAEMMIAPEQLDADRFKINVRNGTLVIHRERKGPDQIEFRPHDPTDFITKMMDVDYDPDARSPAYDKFLEKVQPNPAVRRLLHQWGGYSLTGSMSEQRFVFFWGKGRNGKTTWLEASASFFGSYGQSVPVETFVDSGRPRGPGQATPDLAMLRGVRMVYTDEPDRFAKLSEGLIKRITGGDALVVRELGQSYFTLRPECKIVISGNHRPRIGGGESSQGMWRRLLFIHWPVTIEVTEVDKLLPEKLLNERSGILNRALEGLRDWIDNDGFVIPDEVAETTEDFRSDSDALGRFLTDCTIQELGAKTSVSDLHAARTAWARANGEPPWSAKTLGSGMLERGYKQSRKDQRCWNDLKLIKAPRDFSTNETDEPPAPLAESDDDSVV